MITMSLSEIAKILGVDAPAQDIHIEGMSTDSRTLSPKNLFISLPGEQFDGHHFVADAAKKGAAAAIVSRKLDLSLPQLVVKDTYAALGKISAAWRARFSLPLIGVTGSNGKTTLKNMIASILRAASGNDLSVLATEGNLNNNIGLPLMLSRLNQHHRYGVIEMGMNHFGEIRYLTELTQPQVAVINNAAAAHLEGLKNIEGVARAKGEIFLGLQPSGIAILNKDDAFFEYWRELVKDNRYITFGLKNSADVTATLSNHSTFILQTPKGKIEINLPLLGQHNIMNALAATAATLAIDIDLAAIKSGLENVQPAPGRLRQHLLNNDVRIIDDTYNANPESVTAAINTLATLSGTKILVLGDMKELGPNAKELHSDIGKKALAAGIHFLLTFGEMSAESTNAFGKNAEHFVDREKLLVALQPHLKNSATILVKGSRSMRMEKIIAALIPENQLENSH